MSLMISISGIRGIVGESLTPDVVVKYAAAFGEYCKRINPKNPEVVLGRDGRITGKIIANIVSSTLLSTGVNVRAVGICPTPTVALAIEQLGAAGGISVTASHNPMQWNGLKFFASTGLFLDAEENKEVWKTADNNEATFTSWEKIGTHTADDSWIRKHIDAVLALPYLDIEKIRNRRLKVVLDAVNSAGGIIAPVFLRELGCEVVEMNCDVSGVFAHTPEPIPENLTDLCNRVKSEKADIGIAVDPDVDRLVLITENGEPFGEEYTIASAIKFVLEKEKQAGRTFTQSVVVNLSTTRAVDDIAAEYGARVHRTPVGEINVAKHMKNIGSIIGGEGSGGVILPAVHTGRDAIVGIGLILQLLADFGGTVSQLKSSLPQYQIAKGKIELGKISPDDALKRIRRSVSVDARVDTNDGLRIDYADYWVHLRKSNTEPIVRVIAEARTMGKAAEVVQKFKQQILT
ncbi:MAG: phosphoglucosamine mutase [Bacteroidetes bacterium]|nr:phosphoglucosamine mutase [Bacteroidota bacterium]MCW5897469.1 phosphoglucosamine mutase [Bacteroidota bacterium]